MHIQIEGYISCPRLHSNFLDVIMLSEYSDLFTSDRARSIASILYRQLIVICSRSSLTPIFLLIAGNPQYNSITMIEATPKRQTKTDMHMKSTNGTTEGVRHQRSEPGVTEAHCLADVDSNLSPIDDSELDVRRL